MFSDKCKLWMFTVLPLHYTSFRTQWDSNPHGLSYNEITHNIRPEMNSARSRTELPKGR